MTRARVQKGAPCCLLPPVDPGRGVGGRLPGPGQVVIALAMVSGWGQGQGQGGSPWVPAEYWWGKGMFQQVEQHMADLHGDSFRQEVLKRQ